MGLIVRSEEDATGRGQGLFWSASIERLGIVGALVDLACWPVVPGAPCQDWFRSLCRCEGGRRTRDDRLERRVERWLGGERKGEGEVLASKSGLSVADGGGPEERKASRGRKGPTERKMKEEAGQPRRRAVDGPHGAAQDERLDRCRGPGREQRLW